MNQSKLYKRHRFHLKSSNM